jgi:hypothetical protein
VANICQIHAFFVDLILKRDGPRVEAHTKWLDFGSMYTNLEGCVELRIKRLTRLHPCQIVLVGKILICAEYGRLNY